MKKLFLTLVPVLLLGTGLRAQLSSGETTLFEIGSPVTTDAANFDNLFRNFPKYIENGNLIEFVSYKKVGTIKNRGQIDRYLKHNLSPATGFYMETITNSGHNGDEECWSHIQAVVASNDRIDIQTEWKKWMDTIEQSIRPGMDVYEIEFIHAMQTRRYYVFVDPTNHRVVTKGNAFAIKIPSQHVTCIDAEK